MWRAWHKRQRRIRRTIKGTYVHRLLGENLFRNYLWVHDRRAVAGSLALGVFIAFTPSIPLQMLLAALGALFYKVNLPIALAACWITNPVTAVPIYLFCWRLGRFILADTVLFESLFDIYAIAERSRLGTLLRQGAYLWMGSLIVATAMAVSAYVAVQLLWTISERLIARQRLRKARVP